MLFDPEMVSDRVSDAPEYLRLFVKFYFGVSVVGRAKEKTAFAPFKSAHQALPVHEGEDDLAVAILSEPLDDEQVLVTDVRLDHRIAGEASEEGKERPWRQQIMQI